MEYYVKNEKGYYVQSGYGYTQSKEEAGEFTIDDLKGLNLDGCTLYEVPDPWDKNPSNSEDIPF